MHRSPPRSLRGMVSLCLLQVALATKKQPKLWVDAFPAGASAAVPAKAAKALEYLKQQVPVGADERLLLSIRIVGPTGNHPRILLENRNRFPPLLVRRRGAGAAIEGSSPPLRPGGRRPHTPQHPRSTRAPKSGVARIIDMHEEQPYPQCSETPRTGLRLIQPPPAKLCPCVIPESRGRRAWPSPFDVPQVARNATYGRIRTNSSADG